jgi:hypothetical protein
LLMFRPSSFCFNRCDLLIRSRWAGVLWKDAMNWCRDGAEMIMRSQPNMLLRFIWVNMSLHVHVLLCETDTHLKFFVHARMSKAVLVCAQSRDVFITACITKEKWLHTELIVRTCFKWLEWLCAEVLISLFHACKKGWLRADAGFSVFQTYAHAYHTKVKWLCSEALLSLYSYMHVLRSQKGQCPAVIYTCSLYSIPTSLWKYTERCLRV